MDTKVMKISPCMAKKWLENAAMAALVAVSAELSGRRISFVRETDDGYRTITAKRKRLGIPRTPEIDKR